MTRYFSVTGLGFGDCGKGLFTDALCRLTDALTVARFNGGAQAGHNVVTADGRHHTFSQFGAGTFLPGVVTVLTAPVAVHPTALLVEARHLSTLGVGAPLDRVMIDAECKITTPFHQASNRIRESYRLEPHGTCGVGVGETQRLSEAYPELVLRYRDLFEEKRALQMLDAIRDTFDQELREYPPLGKPHLKAEFDLLQDLGSSRRWMQMLTELLKAIKPATKEQLKKRFQLDGTVIFEGAQGILLDQDYGFHPHTTWSTTGPAAAQAVLTELGIPARIHKLGVSRSYLTRHGPGPFPTEDNALARLAEPHNTALGWQGRFRRGHPDGVLLRYAVDAAGELDGLLLSHLDYFKNGSKLSWCRGYRLPAAFELRGVTQNAPDGSDLVVALSTGKSGDLKRQVELTEALFAALPIYEDRPIASSSSLIDHFEATTGLTVVATSLGPAADSVSFNSKLLDA